MKCRITRIASLAMLVAWGVGVVLAQDSPSPESLADLARQAKAQRAKSREKSKVYTNEDIEALPPLPMSTTEVPPGEPTAQPTTGNKVGNDALKARPAEAGNEKKGEEYFRARMGKLEERLELDQREVNVFQQTLGQNQMLYYPDPVEGLLQSSGPTAMSDIHRQQDLIAKKQADVAADQAAIDDLQVELRREDGDPGWLRNVTPGEPRASTAEQPGAQGEKNWNARFKAARARLADAEEQLQVTQDELKLLRIQDVHAINSSAKAELDGKAKDKEDEVAQKQQEKDEAQKALDALQQEFDAAGAQEEIVKQ
jgi:hypothetical protein